MALLLIALTSTATADGGLSQTIGSGPDDMITQSRPMELWSAAFGLTGVYSNRPAAGSAVDFGLRASLGLKYLDVGAELPAHVVMAESASGSGAPGPTSIGDNMRFWAKLAIPGLRRASNGAGAGVALTFNLRLGGDHADERRVTFSPGIVTDHRNARGFLSSTSVRVDFRLADEVQREWAQLVVGLGESLPLWRRRGLWLWAAAEVGLSLPSLPNDVSQIPYAARAGVQLRFMRGWYCSAGGGLEAPSGGSPGWVAMLSCAFTPSALPEGEALAMSMEPAIDDPNAAPYDGCKTPVDMAETTGALVAGPPQTGRRSAKLCPSPTPETIAELQGRLRKASQALAGLSDQLSEDEYDETHHRLFQAMTALDHYQELVGRGRLRRSMALPLWVTGGALLEDDVTGVGVADDALLPIVAVGLLATWLLTQGPAPTAELDQVWRSALAAGVAAARGVQILMTAQGNVVHGHLVEEAIAELIAEAQAAGIALVASNVPRAALCSKIRQMMDRYRRTDTGKGKKLISTAKGLGCMGSRANRETKR